MSEQQGPGSSFGSVPPSLARPSCGASGLSRQSLSFAHSHLRRSQRGHEIATVLARCPADALDFAPALGCLHKAPRLAIGSAAPEVPPAAPATAAELLADLKQPSEAAKVNWPVPTVAREARARITEMNGSHESRHRMAVVAFFAVRLCFEIAPINKTVIDRTKN